MDRLVPPERNMYVAAHAAEIWAAQSLPRKSTGTGCFFFLKKALPAHARGGADQGFILRHSDMHS